MLTASGDMQVAFSSFTNIGPVMALAIAVHNIPEVLLLCPTYQPASAAVPRRLAMVCDPLGHVHLENGIFAEV